MSKKTSIILLENLPDDISPDEICSFLQSIQILSVDSVPRVEIVRKPSTFSKTSTTKAFVQLTNESDLNLATKKCYQTRLLRVDKNGQQSDFLVKVSGSSRQEMEREVISRGNVHMTCEWIDCNRKFFDRSLYLSHINQEHVPTFHQTGDSDQKCQWQGCYHETNFENVQHFQLHLSFHAYHNQLMSIGQKIMDITIPRPVCNYDNSTRNVLTSNLANVLICGWKDCNGEFYDAETFFQHVAIHAIEDVEIPMMSKEKLKKLRFAKCQWLNCQESFKKKSHLKMHLHKHTQAKFVACPVCGILFCYRRGFLKHCYRQETPTSIDPISVVSNFVDDDVDDPEGILTIDEDPNQSSIVIHLPHNIQLSTGDPDSNSKTQPKQLATLLVNFNPPDGQTKATVLASSNNVETGDGNVIQLQLAPANSNHPEGNTERKYQCQQCPKSFHIAALLHEHMSKHNRKFQCPHCPYSAGYESRLKEHILFRHNDTYEFRCKFCGQKAKNNRSFRRHLEINHSDKKNVICQVCDKEFTSYYSLNRHVRVQHLKEQIIFACHLCQKVYNRGSNLSRHLIGTHGLKIANGWSRFTYDKQQSDGIFRINPLSCTQS